MIILSLMAALAVQTAGPAPTPGAAATLVQARHVRLNFDGRSWDCGDGGLCSGRGGGASQPLMRECRRFVSRVGLVSSFSRGALALTAAEVAECNASDSARSRGQAGAR